MPHRAKVLHNYICFQLRVMCIGCWCVLDSDVYWDIVRRCCHFKLLQARDTKPPYLHIWTSQRQQLNISLIIIRERETEWHTLSHTVEGLHWRLYCFKAVFVNRYCETNGIGEDWKGAPTKESVQLQCCSSALFVPGHYC